MLQKQQSTVQEKKLHENKALSVAADQEAKGEATNHQNLGARPKTPSFVQPLPSNSDIDSDEIFYSDKDS